MLLSSHEQKLCVLPRRVEMGFTGDTEQTGVVLVTIFIGPYYLLHENRENVVNFILKLGNLDVAIPG